MNAIIGGAVSILVVGLFAGSAWSKLNPANRAYYLGVMADYGITHSATAVRCIVSVGVLEALVALLVMVPMMPIVRAAGLLGASAMLFAYLALMTLQMLRGKAGMDCGCAGPAHPAGIGVPLLLRNLVLVLLAVYASQFSPPSTVAAWSLAVALGLFLVLCAMNVELLIGNHQKLQNLRGPRHLARH